MKKWVFIVCIMMFASVLVSSCGVKKSPVSPEPLPVPSPSQTDSEDEE